MENDENTKYLKSIARNLQFFFYLALTVLFGTAGLIALELG